MSFSPGAWSQIKNTTCIELVKALEADGWVKDTTHGAVQAYRNPNTRQRVTIHFHPGKVYGKDTLKELLNDIGWTEKDLRRLTLIK